ncbi:MAG: DNA repair ATPase [Aliiglaciecola sp.]
MIFPIIIILIVSLVVVAIVVNALQQHREKIEAERRTEIAKQKSVIDETENVLMTIDTIPVSQKLIAILHTRVLNALKVIFELNPSIPEIRQRIKQSQERIKMININAQSPSQDSFSLPDSDKMVIQYIQAVKKFRVLLRSEHAKGKVDTQTFTHEDRALASLQLRVNVETLAKRGNAALQSNMLGSARQYFEKAITALEGQTQPDQYNIERKAQLDEQLRTIQDNLKNANAQDRAKKQEEERDELDELFAPKKKW